jgi:hypothetical protein
VKEPNLHVKKLWHSWQRMHNNDIGLLPQCHGLKDVHLYYQEGHNTIVQPKNEMKVIK